jgi:hypothetical protein
MELSMTSFASTVISPPVEISVSATALKHLILLLN